MLNIICTKIWLNTIVALKYKPSSVTHMPMVNILQISWRSAAQWGWAFRWAWASLWLNTKNYKIGQPLGNSVVSKWLVLLSLHNYINSKWIKYTDLDGWSVDIFPEKDRNKIFRLSTIYPIYDWIDDDGFNEFKNWVN